MRVFGVDPGPKQSGWCYIHASSQWVLDVKFGHDWNQEVIEHLEHYGKAYGSMVTGYEWVKSYGRAVGEDTFRTAYTCGRVRQVAEQFGAYHEPTRPDVINHFIGKPNVPKSEVRKILLSRFGGENAKKKGGTLHGITNHAWDALAVCVYLCEKYYEYDKNYWRNECPF